MSGGYSRHSGCAKRREARQRDEKTAALGAPPAVTRMLLRITELRDNHGKPRRSRESGNPASLGRASLSPRIRGDDELKRCGLVTLLLYSIGGRGQDRSELAFHIEAMRRGKRNDAASNRAWASGGFHCAPKIGTLSPVTRDTISRNFMRRFLAIRVRLRYILLY